MITTEGSRDGRLAEQRQRRALSLFATFVAIWAVSAPAVAAPVTHYDFETDSRKTRLWLPEDLDTVRGILIIGNGAGGDVRGSVYESRYQRFGETHGFAVIGTGRWGNLSGDEIMIWEEHLDALASLSGHPELVNAPWAPIGFSNGGQMSYGFNAVRPEKTIAFITNKGCCYNDRLPPEAALKTPGILIAGELDSEYTAASIQGLFDDNRARGALWSWVEEEGKAHEGRADRLVLPFMDQAIQLRYPPDQLPSADSGVTLLDLEETDGWLVDQATWHDPLVEIAPYDAFQGDPAEAGWLLNEATANLYRAFATYDKDVAFLGVNTALDPVLFQRGFPVKLDLRIGTAAVPGWSKVQLFADEQCLDEVLPGDTPTDSVDVHAAINSPGAHGLFALVTHADGITVSTTGILTYIILPGPLEGDLNGDGRVASADLDLVRAHWGETGERGMPGDADQSGGVNSADFEIVRANWGWTVVGAVPEPAAGLMILAGAACLGRLVRARPVRTRQPREKRNRIRRR